MYKTLLFIFAAICISCSTIPYSPIGGVTIISSNEEQIVLRHGSGWYSQAENKGRNHCLTQGGKKHYMVSTNCGAANYFTKSTDCITIYRCSE